MSAVVDQTVDPNDQDHFAYGPYMTHMLARRKLNQGGGATRASTNADSYAWLANSKYFYQLTDYWPQPDGWKDDDMNGFSAKEYEGWTLNLGIITETTTDEEISQRLNSIIYNSTTASSAPAAGRALSIAMLTAINPRGIGRADLNNEWHFYTTPVGHAVGCDWKSNSVEEITTQGPSDTKLPSSTDPKNLPWPGGEYKLNIDGEECVYKCDGTNSGRLLCPQKEIACREDSQKSRSEGMLKCSAYTFSHAAIYCDF